MHGGTSKNKGTSYASKPGQLYSKYLTEEERKSFDNVELGTVDAELRLMRIRLERALKEEKEQNQPELEVLIERDGGGPATVAEERHYKKRDYRNIIQVTLARIESLEKTRKELLAAGEGGSDEEPKPQHFIFEVIDGRKQGD